MPELPIIRDRKARKHGFLLDISIQSQKSSPQPENDPSTHDARREIELGDNKQAECSGRDLFYI